MAINANFLEAGQPAGTAITTGNSGGAAGRAFDSVAGVVTYDSTQRHSGGLAAKVDMAAGTTSQVRWLDGADQAGAVGYARFYIRLASLPSQNLSVAYITDHSNVFLMRARIRTTGVVDLIDQAGAIMGTTTAAVVTGQWVRIEIKVTCSATVGQGQVRLYNSPDSLTATEDLTTTAAWNTGATRPGGWRFGGLTSTAATDVFWIDDVASSDVDWPGPQRIINQWTATGGEIDTEIFTNPTPGNWLVALVTARVIDNSAPLLNLGDASRNAWALLATDTRFANSSHTTAQLQAEVWACPAVAFDGWPGLLTYVAAMAMSASDVGSICVDIIELAGMGNGWITVDSITVGQASAATSLSIAVPGPAGAQPCVLLAAAATDNVTPGAISNTGAGFTGLTQVSDAAPSLVMTSAWQQATTGQTAAWSSGATNVNWAGIAVAVRVTGLAPASVAGQTNPNWPLSQFQVGLGYDTSTPMPRVRWTDQTPLLLSLDADRGLQAELGTSEQGTGDLRILDITGAYQVRPVATAAPASAAGTTTTIKILDANAALIHLTDFFRLTTAAGALKELNVFQVTALASAGGTTTVTFARADGSGGGALAATVAGDIFAGIAIDLYIPWRQLMTWAGKTHVWASGWLRDLPRVYTGPAYAEVQAEGGDALEILTAANPSPLRGELARRNPSHWWPLDDAQGSTYAANASKTSNVPLVQTLSKFGAGSALADFGASTQGATQDSTVTPPSISTNFGDAGSCWSQGGQVAADLATKGYALVATASDFPPIGPGVTISGVVMIGDGGFDPLINSGVDPTVMILRNGDPGGGVGQGSLLKLSIIGTNIGTNFQPKITVWDKATHASTATTCGPFQLGTSGFKTWAVTFNQTSWAMYNGGTLAASGACNLPATFTIVDIGGEADPFFHGRSFGGLHQDIAIIPRRITAAEAANLETSVRNGRLANEVTSSRISRKLNTVGSQLPRILNTAPAQISVEDNGASGTVVDHANELASWEDSLVFADAANQLQYRNRATAYLQTPRAVLGENSAGGEIPYQPGLSPGFNPTFIYNNVSNANTRFANFDIGTSTFAAVDDTSNKAYGDKPLKHDTRFQSLADAWHMVWWYLARYAYPRQRVETVVIEAAGAPERWPFVLSVETGDILTVNKRQSGVPMLSFRCRVIRVQPHLIYSDGEVSGSVTLTLAAAPPPVPIAGDPINGVIGGKVLGA